MHPEIFKQFGINVGRCYKFRGNYICETGEGTKAIRISEYSPDQIVLEYNIKQHLIEKGFTCLDQLYISSHNTPYVIYHNRVYVMTDWNNGQAADFYNINDINKSIKMLADIHIAGKGFSNFPKELKQIQIKNIGHTYEKRYIETNKLKRKIEGQGTKTEFEVLYLKNGHIYQDFQEKSMEIICKNKYKKLIDKATKKQSIAHGKYTYHNIIAISPTSTMITGFEKSKYDVQLTDLVYIIRRVMQRNQWDINLLISIIEAYNKLSPLSKQEWDLMKGMIIFPEEFAKLCNQYFNSKRRWDYDMFYRRFTNMLGCKEDYIRCMEEVIGW